MTKLERLVAEHDTVLLDAMGVLIDKRGAIDGAADFIDHLNRTGKSYFVLTNISGDDEAGIYDRLRREGIPLQCPDNVISAGTLVRRYIDSAVAPGARVAFIGPERCQSVLDTGRHEVVPCWETEAFDVLAILDDEGFVFRDTLESALSACVRSFKQRKTLPLFLLANGDCAYPRGAEGYAFGSGIFVTMLSEALEKLLGVRPEVILFGKPSDRIFAEARRRGGGRSMMMIGDQIATDILGANRFGITSALVLTGLNSQQDAEQGEAAPDHILESLRVRPDDVPPQLPDVPSAGLAEPFQASP